MNDFQIQILDLFIIITGFGDGVDNTNCWEPIIKYIDQQFNIFLEAETRVNRVTIPDNRVHVCLYFLAPTGHGLRSVDVEFMRRLHDKVGVINIIVLSYDIIFRSISFL